MPTRPSARVLAFLAGAGLTLALAGLDSALLLRLQRERHLADARRTLEGQAELLAERLGRGAQAWLALLRMVSGLETLRHGADRSAALRMALSDLVAGAPELYWLGLYTAEGELLGGSDPFPPFAEGGALARRAATTGEPLIDGPHAGPNGPMLYLAVPQPPQVLAAEVSLGWAEELRQATQRHGPPGLVLQILDATGQPLLAQHAPPPGEDLLGATAPIIGSPYLVRATLPAHAVLEGLQPLALRLGAGVFALAMAVGGMAATLAYLAARAVAAHRDKAERDPLTGLGNRAGLQAWATAAHGQPLAVIAIDLDGFKPINDRHGHAVGDEVLRGVASAMSQRIRPGDAAIRLGGDEFLLGLLSRAGEDTAAVAEAVAWRVIHALDAGVETSAGPLPIGASAGVALVPEDAADLATAIAQADAALYDAKRAGKRTVCRAALPVPAT